MTAADWNRAVTASVVAVAAVALASLALAQGTTDGTGRSGRTESGRPRVVFVAPPGAGTADAFVVAMAVPRWHDGVGAAAIATTTR